MDCNVDPEALMIPPAVTAGMAANYVKSEIKSWFAPPSAEILHLAAQAEKETASHGQ